MGSGPRRSAARHVVALGEGGRGFYRTCDRFGGAGHTAGGGHDVAWPDERLRRDTPHYEHSPPTSSGSTMATDNPKSAHRRAAVSPAGPAPMTTTSKVSMIAAFVMPVHSQSNRC